MPINDLPAWGEPTTTYTSSNTSTNPTNPAPLNPPANTAMPGAYITYGPQGASYTQYPGQGQIFQNPGGWAPPFDAEAAVDKILDRLDTIIDKMQAMQERIEMLEDDIEELNG